MRACLGGSETIVIKAGTAVVSTQEGYPSLVRLSGIVEQAAALMAAKKRVVLVTSGAVGCGRSRLRKQAALNRSFRDLRSAALFESARTKVYDSACAAAGQLALMSLYETLFASREVECSQFLVTQQDFEDEARSRNLQYAITEILEVGMIPIVNENDAVSANVGYDLPATASFSDNDGLAALVSRLVSADLLILLSDVDALYDRPPTDHGARRIETVHVPLADDDADDDAIVFGDKSLSGRGGMEAKVAAAKRAVRGGVKCVALASGQEPDVVSKILSGDDVGTLFFSSASRQQQRRNGRKVNGTAKKIEGEDELLLGTLTRVREASRALQALSGEQRSALLRKVAEAVGEQREAILAANARDVANSGDVEPAIRQRLGLSGKKLDAVAKGTQALAESEDPVQNVVERRELSPGLILEKRTCALGVVLVIFEARPDALAQIASLALRTGCGLILKGGKEAEESNAILSEVIADALAAEAATFSSSPFTPQHARDLFARLKDREAVAKILAHPDSLSYVDLVVPRGSNALVRHVQQSTKIPVLGHADGICHVYLDAAADLAKAEPLVVDAKTDYPAACNAAETLLVHRDLVSDAARRQTFRDRILAPLRAADVELYGGPAFLAIDDDPDSMKAAELPLRREYGGLAMTVEVVASTADAIAFINAHGSHHTDCVVTEDHDDCARTFLRDVDSACVFHNASTRFSDGFRFGLGAELGVATGRIHARGPVGVHGFLTYKWALASDDVHTQHHFAAGTKTYTHRDLPLQQS